MANQTPVNTDELPELYRAAAHGDTELCRKLLDEGADVNGRTQEGHATALIGAAKNGHADTCLVLLNRGADVDAQDATGSTALHHAAFRYHKDVCQELIDADADVSIQSQTGLTAADKASSEMPFNIGVDDLKEMIESAGRRQALLRLSERSRPVEQDLASVEQTQARRRNDFMM